MIEQIVLVRHGETVHNAAGVAQGWQDSDLSEAGLRQVRRLAARMPQFGVNAIFSSPLSRALKTAEALRDETGLEICVLDDLREMNYGAWEGKRFLEVRHDDFERYKQWIEDPAAPCPAGESHVDLLRRMQCAFRSIESSANGRPLRPVVVTHGTAIRVGTTGLLGWPLANARNLAMDNASISVFAWRHDRYVLKAWNDTSHLENPE
ncbi:MAG TPA: histidine phosphatase family protein [Thermoanaerobaculia bacterium]|nr:histidine phosphatase family protein [Thermoanaerobaculia bacterium]